MVLDGITVEDAALDKSRVPPRLRNNGCTTQYYDKKLTCQSDMCICTYTTAAIPKRISDSSKNEQPTIIFPHGYTYSQKCRVIYLQAIANQDGTGHIDPTYSVDTDDC